MKQGKLISLSYLCEVYQVEMLFFDTLCEQSLIEIIIVKEEKQIPESFLEKVEQIIRLNKDLGVNPEGIDVIFNLLRKVETLEQELVTVKNRLAIYEDL